MTGCWQHIQPFPFISPSNETLYHAQPVEERLQPWQSVEKHNPIVTAIWAALLCGHRCYMGIDAIWAALLYGHRCYMGINAIWASMLYGQRSPTQGTRVQRVPCSALELGALPGGKGAGDIPSEALPFEGLKEDRIKNPSTYLGGVWASAVVGDRI